MFTKEEKMLIQRWKMPNCNRNYVFDAVSASEGLFLFFLFTFGTLILIHFRLSFCRDSTLVRR